MEGCEAVFTTPYGSTANVNNSNNPRVYLTYKRAKEPLSPGDLGVTDITVVIPSKGESPPPAFCQVLKSLNRGMVGNDVFVCYKKSIPKQAGIAYKPAVLSRYPMEDYPDFSFPSEVALFCLPMGAVIESWLHGAKFPYPQFSTFVLTLDSGEKVFGSVVSFYEDFLDDTLTEDQRKDLGMTEKEQEKAVESEMPTRTAFCNKAICILSHYPFFRPFEKFLIYLYRLSISGPHNIPIERFISHFIHEVPFPAPHRPTILVQLNHEELTLSLPEDSPLPNSGSSFVDLLTNLHPEHCISLLLYALMENKIVLHSLRRDVLTRCAESMSMMLFPLRWQCTYIPLCPLGLSYVLNAPTPVLVGLDSRFFDLYFPPPDVVCVDLDTHNISLSDDKKLSYKLMPKKAVRTLKNTLTHLSDKVTEWRHKVRQDEQDDEFLGPYDLSLRIHRTEALFELAIQEAFLKFMASVLKGYKQFLKPITSASARNATDAPSLFDMQGFLKTRDKSYIKFYSQLIRTQMFCRFIEDRSFVSDDDASLAFFDECLEKMEDSNEKVDANIRLLEPEPQHTCERTMFISPPEPIGLPPGEEYSYPDGFPQLNKHLFLDKPKPMISLDRVKKISQGISSPMTRRSKFEMKQAQKLASQHASVPHLWAKCLLSNVYSLWFIHLPAYLKLVTSKSRTLRVALEALRRMRTVQLQPPDEVCFRVLMQLCGQYNQPVLAIKVLYEMKRQSVQPNAITYGYYNKAVLESCGVRTTTNAARLLWKKLHYVIIAVAWFKRLPHMRVQEADKISRLSEDSALDTQEPMCKEDQDFIMDLVNISSAPSRERVTDILSDRGYGTMTEDVPPLPHAASTTSVDSQSDNLFLKAWTPVKSRMKGGTPVHQVQQPKEQMLVRPTFPELSHLNSILRTGQKINREFLEKHPAGILWCSDAFLPSTADLKQNERVASIFSNYRVALRCYIDKSTSKGGNMAKLLKSPEFSDIDAQMKHFTANSSFNSDRLSNCTTPMPTDELTVGYLNESGESGADEQKTPTPVNPTLTILSPVTENDPLGALLEPDSSASDTLIFNLPTAQIEDSTPNGDIMKDFEPFKDESFNIRDHFQKLKKKLMLGTP